MFLVRVKICGIQCLEEGKSAVAAGVHALGFVFAESPRKVSPVQAQQVIRKLPPWISKVGVFVNEDIELVNEIGTFCGLDTLQFHGEETPNYCSRFPGYKIIKTFSVTSDWNAERETRTISMYPVDALLLDTCYPDIKGGGGKTFNWAIAASFQAEGSLKLPLVLAGGLNQDNVSTALEKVNPFGLDLSSGVESQGKKDPEKIKAFMQQVHNWNYEQIRGHVSCGGEK